jgi:geranylgeranyl pyrophosphate synthase
LSFSRASLRALGGRQALLSEVERLGRDVLSVVAFEEALQALASGDGLPPELAHEQLFAGGVPRIRPLLLLLAARAESAEHAPDPEVAFEAACVAELIQGAILLHDKALGRQEGRRRRVARRVLRSASHWLGANHLTLRALEIARHLPAPEILGDVLDTLREVAEGQSLGEELRQRAATPAEALQHVEGQAGAVFAFACRAGGRLGQLDRQGIAGLSRYGRHIGVAWQLSEDLSSFEQPEARQALLRDAVWTRPLYPVAWATDQDPQILSLWERLREEDDDQVAEDLAEGVRSGGGLVAGRAALIRQTWAARQALQTLPDTPAREAMDRIAASLARAAA